ncbi:MAG: fibronectin type III domain-containing protein [Salinivirgaceae bacterium]
MKRFGFIVSLLTSILFSETMYGQEPTVQASNISFSNINSNSTTISWTRGDGASVIIVARETSVSAGPSDGVSYTADAAYGSGSAIVGGFPSQNNYVVYIGTGSSVTVTSLTGGTQYEYYAFEFNGSGGSEDYLVSFTGNNAKQYTAPATQATNIVFSSIQQTSVHLSWTNGDGTGRILVAKASSAVDNDPVNGSTYSNPSSTFGSGDDIGSGNYVLFNGLGNNVTITGLTQGITYHFKVFGYVGSGTQTTYKTDGFSEGFNPNSIVAGSPPSTQASEISFTLVAGTSMTANWIRGSGDNVLILAKVGDINNNPVDGNGYSASSTFGAGTLIDGAYVVYNGTGSSIEITGLTEGTNYSFRAYEFYNSGTSSIYNTTTATNNPNSQTTLAGEPTSQASDIVISNVTASSAQLNWTNGSGENRIVLARTEYDAEVAPSDASSYTANAVFGSGNTTGTGNYVIFNGAEGPVTVTNLSPSTTYYFTVYEYNNSGANTDYKIDGYPSGTNPNSTTTLKGQPAQASELSFTNITENTMTVSWTSGGGDGSVLIAREASAIADFPIDGTTYTGNLAFGSGGDNLGNNTFVLYNGTAETADITGLTLGTTYYFMVCEYNNSGTETDYNTNPGTNNPGSQSTLKTTPATQASGIEITDIQANQFTLTWTNGDGENRVVLMKQGAAVNAIPSNGTDYSANPVFGSGTPIGTGNYVVFNGSTNTVTVTNLEANTIYYAKIFDYNNSGTEILFKTDGFSEFNPASAKTLPTLQADNIVFSNVQNTSIDLSWTRGNGDSVLVVAKAGTTLAETPTEGTIYTANNTFGSDETIAPGVYVVYSGTRTSVSVDGLTASTEYVFKAFEFNNSEPYTSYLNTDGSSNNPATQSTTGDEPTTQASAVSFANTSSTQTDVSWTAGNGDGRIVLAYKGDTLSALPVDGTTYTANAIFGSGSEIGTGNFVVALGDVTGETVTGLTPESEYQFRVFEYSGSGSSINYLTNIGSDNPDSVTTLVGKPVIQASNVTFDQLDAESYRVNWTHGSGDSLLVVAVAGSFTASENPVDETDYAADAAFSSGTPIGNGFVVYKGISADGSVIVSNLTEATNYSFKVFEYNDIAGVPYYQTADGTDNPMSRFSLDTEPTTQANTINFSGVGATQITLDWSPRGDGSNVIVIAREAADILTNPIDGTSYNGNNDFTLAEVYATDHHVVFNGSGTGATITNLNPNTTYYFRAYEYNGSATTCNYLTSLGNSTSTTTIKTEPTLQAGNFSFTSLTTSSYTVNWERGNGDGVIILAKAGSAVDVIPSDGTDTYIANATFSSGDELGTGNYVVYKGTGTTEAITFPESPVNYFFSAFEYTNSGTAVDYLTTIDSSASQFTLSAEPATQVSAFTNTVYNDTISLAWTNGTGTGRIILAKHGSAVDATPTDGIAYTADAIFGNGAEIGTGNFVVYAGNQPDTVRITGLLASETYHFQAFEYDDTGALNYLLTDAPTTSATTGTKGAPSIQASEINFTSLATDGFTINWTNGNGENRMVVMREGDAGTINNPIDNITYTASSDWTTKGTQLGSSGYYTVYNGSGNSVSVSNLTANTTYWVQVFEYNNPTDFETYNVNTGTGNPASQTTLKTAPSMQASGISSGTITSNSIAISWDNGNGANRIAVINTSNSFSVYDGLDPLADTYYSGSGEQVVYNGVGTSVTVSGLTAGTTYWFKVLEYNNSETYTLYHSVDTTDNPISFATLGTATWIGTTNDWTLDGNWSTAVVPTSLQSVIISTGQSVYPELSSSHSVDDMVIEAGATITIANGGHLEITHDLLLESPTGSGASGALVIPGDGTISVGGTSTMERYNPTPLSRHLISYPINSPNVTPLLGYYIYAYNETGLAWENLNTGSTFGVMQGFNIYDGPQMINFTGAFNNGNQSINVTNSSPGDDSYGWNLVGNPYPCTIDWDADSGWTLTNVDATAYVYNGSTYDTWNSSIGDGTGNGSPLIAAGQGFFVHASANGSLGVSNAVRVTDGQNLQKKVETNKQLIRIETSGNSLKSDALLVFYSDATDNFDSSFDAYKLTGDEPKIPEVYFLNVSDQLAINTFAANKLDELNETPQLVFPLGLLNQTSGLVSFRLTETLNIPSDVYIYVFDALTSTYTNLRESAYEMFIAGEASYIEDRFELVLSKNALSINEENLDLKIWSFASEKTIFIKSGQVNETSSRVYLYDITGRIISTNEWNGMGLQEFKVQAAGTYIIKIHIEKNIITQKVVVQ